MALNRQQERKTGKFQARLKLNYRSLLSLSLFFAPPTYSYIHRLTSLFSSSGILLQQNQNPEYLLRDGTEILFSEALKKRQRRLRHPSFVFCHA